MLHDVTKEMSQDELVKKYNIILSDDDKRSPETLHALTAVPYITENFQEYALDDILLAIRSHTTGDTSMSTLAKILFVADYIEEGRKYASSIELRNRLYTELEASGSESEALSALNKAVIASIDYTVAYLESKSNFVHPKTRLTKEAILKMTQV